MQLQGLKVWCSPMTGTIYAGYANKDGITAKIKIDVTKQVVDAVMQHMHITGEEYECMAGDLSFSPKAIETTEPPSDSGSRTLEITEESVYGNDCIGGKCEP